MKETPEERAYRLAREKNELETLKVDLAHYKRMSDIAMKAFGMLCEMHNHWQCSDSDVGVRNQIWNLAAESTPK